MLPPRVLGGGLALAASSALLGMTWKEQQMKTQMAEERALKAKVRSQARHGENKSVEHPRKWNYNWDGRNPEHLVKPLRDSERDNPAKVAARAEKVSEKTGKISKRVLLIRHGQYNLDGQDDEHKTLTDLGREQARETGRRVKALLEQMKDNTAKDENGNPLPLRVRFVKSTMTRATETGDLILEELGDELKAAVFTEKEPPGSCDLIREGAPVAPVPAHPGWKPDEFDFFQEGSRIEAGFRKHLYRADPDETAEVVDVLVCHGNVIRYFVCRALQFNPDAWLHFNVNNASITHLNLRPSGRVSIHNIGEAGHLPKKMLTYN